jgi:FKBP-type peptidyl-prolyl cis-trans isomerase
MIRGEASDAGSSASSSAPRRAPAGIDRPGTGARARVARAALLSVAAVLSACDGSPAPVAAPGSGISGAQTPGAQTPGTPPAKPPQQRIRDVTSPVPVTFQGERGAGEPIVAGDVAVIHYLCRTTGGHRVGGTVPDELAGSRTPFDPLPADRDARRAAPAPFAFHVGRGHVVPGLDRGVLGLRPGDHAILVVRPELGYGDPGFGNAVPGDATLRYEVWVLERVPLPVIERLKVGDGPAAVNGKTAVIHLRVLLPDGTVVEDTKRPRPGFPEGGPVRLHVYGGEVTEGLDRIVKNLRVGDVARSTVHWFWHNGAPELAGTFAVVPAQTALVYEVEFLSQED